jgi:hypothetical protein
MREETNKSKKKPWWRAKGFSGLHA